VQHRKLNSFNMEWSVNWAELFGAERPLIVEIGFGNADYLVALAQANPDCNIIGFELSGQSMVKAEKKIISHKLTNARAIHSRGETALHHLFTPASIHQIHINYPDPWFKTRHAGRRIMQRDTLDAIVNRLEVGGLFFLATDIVDYAEMSHELLAVTPGLDNLLDAPYVNQFPERLIVTKYEEKGIQEGRPGNYFKYRRNAHPAPDVPVQKEWSVPHIILKTPMQPQDIAAKVEKMVFHAGDIHIALLDSYWNPRYNTVLFEVMIEEPTIEQHIALALNPREKSGDFTLKYATFGMPRPTEGMHHATNFIAEWIVSLHPDAQITAKKIAVE
jgi:tRNA (guanine-N7-)-methyltransferase